VSFNRLVDKAVSLLYWKENQVKTMKPFWSRSNDIPKFKYLEIICCIITYSHASRFIVLGRGLFYGVWYYYLAFHFMITR